MNDPLVLYASTVPRFTLDADLIAALSAGTAIWVRQIGSHARSPALLLATLP